MVEEEKRFGAGLGCLFVDEVMARDDGTSRAAVGLAAARVNLSFLLRFLMTSTMSRQRTLSQALLLAVNPRGFWVLC